MEVKAYPKYKPSGVEWLDNIPAHWEVKRLRFLAEVNPSKSKVASMHDIDVSFLPMEKLSEDGQMILEDRPISAVYSGFTYFENGDVIVAKITPCFENGKCALADGLTNGIGFGTTELHVLRPFSNTNLKFLYYVTKSDLFLKLGEMEMKGAAGQKRVPEDFIKDFTTGLPDFDEQNSIAGYLDNKTACIDGLIEKRHKLLSLLQEKRAALISQAVTKGLDPSVSMKDTGILWLGEIPAHWKVKRLKNLLSPAKGAIKTGPFGSQLTVSDMENGTVKIYNQRTVIDGDFEIGENYISKGKFLELRAFEVFPGDVLVTTRGTIGRTAIVPPDAERGILHPCLMRLQPDAKKVLKEYIRLIIENGLFVFEQLKLLSNATTIEVIYSESLKNVILPLPTFSEQQEILNYTKQLEDKLGMAIRKIQEQIQHLREYRQALISAAVTGKIDVREESGHTLDSLTENKFSATVKTIRPDTSPGSLRLVSASDIHLTISPAVLEMMENFANLRVTIPPFNNSIIELSARAHEFNQKLSQSLTSISRNMLDPLKPLLEAQSKLSTIAKAVLMNQGWMTDLTKVNQTWLENLAKAANNITELQTHLANGLVGLSNNMIATEAFMRTINFSALEASYALSQSIISKYSDAFNKYVSQYSEFMGSFGSPEIILQFSRIALLESSKELAATSCVTGLVTSDPGVHDSEELEVIGQSGEEIIIIEQALHSLKPDFVRPLRGAYEAIKSTNVDKARQALVSLRELLWHLLRFLAPDNDVYEWLPENPCSELVDNGKPTINARIQYICRKIDNPKFTKLVTLDAKCYRELISLLNELHNINPDYTMRELKLLYFRTGSIVYYIANIAIEDC